MRDVRMLSHYDIWNYAPWQIDGENASPSGKVPRVDPAMVGFDAPSAEREAQAQTGSIRASLLERAEEVVGIRAGQATAFVLDLDEDALGAGAHPQRHDRVRPRELERVLQQIGHDGSEHLSISLDGDAFVHRHNGELHAPGVGFQCRS